MEQNTSVEHLSEIVDSLLLSLEESERGKEPFWKENAKKTIISLEKGQNAGVIAETATGKTIIALLISAAYILVENYRVLFLAPRRILVHQHQALLNSIGSSLNITTKVIIWGVKNREWKDNKDSIIFATPQMFLSDAKKGLVSVEDFNLIIFDEFHRAVGKYSYVKIAGLGKASNKKIIGLSASPGHTDEKIELLKKESGIQTLIQAKREMPKKLEDLILVEPDKIILDIEEKFLLLLGEIEKEMKLCGAETRGEGTTSFSSLNQAYPIPESFLKKMYSYAESLNLECSERWDLLSLLAAYRKLKYAYKVCLTESYETFLQYARKLETEDKTKAARRIFFSPIFSEIVEMSSEFKDKHPKVLAFLENARWLFRYGMRGIVFVGEKTTGIYLKDILNRRIPLAETIFGGRGKKDVKLQQESIEKLKKKELFFLVATSVIEEGLNVPEIDVVVHYSSPVTEISKIQRSGRTARTKTGNVIYIVLNHRIDKMRYWKTLRREKQMKKLLNGMEERTAPTSYGSLQKPRRRRNKRCLFTIDLFNQI